MKYIIESGYSDTIEFVARGDGLVIKMWCFGDLAEITLGKSGKADMMNWMRRAEGTVEDFIKPIEFGNREND